MTLPRYVAFTGTALTLSALHVAGHRRRHERIHRGFLEQAPRNISE